MICLSRQRGVELSPEKNSNKWQWKLGRYSQNQLFLNYVLKKMLLKGAITLN